MTSKSVTFSADRSVAPSKPDLAGIKLNKDRDYNETQLGKRMDNAKLIGDIVDNWLRIAPLRRTVVFCVNVSHSKSVCAAFERIGVVAEHLDGETPADERADILERVKNGSTQVLCNVFVASYGLDIPSLDCCVLARPTKNITLYLQTVGRVLRTFPGKIDAIQTYPPFAVELLNSGKAHALFDTRKAPSKVLDVLVATQDSVTQRSKELAGVLRALTRAMAYRQQHPDQRPADLLRPHRCPDRSAAA